MGKKKKKHQIPLYEARERENFPGPGFGARTTGSTGGSVHWCVPSSSKGKPYSSMYAQYLAGQALNICGLFSRLVVKGS